jgi:hypothetical protein
MHTKSHWSFTLKILFRFFFAFLSLQVLTENFISFIFGYDIRIWEESAKIFTPPCIWLNETFFHFKYIPQGWTTFSGSLHTVRDVVYIIVSVLVGIVWTIADRKRTNYNRLYYWYAQCLSIVISTVVFAYGIIKLIPVQMPFPSFIDLQKRVGELSPFELVWTVFGYGQPYQIFTGIAEAVGAVLLLFQKTKTVGTILIITVMINVILIDYTFSVGDVLITACYILLATLFISVPYASQLFNFFFKGRYASLSLDFHIPPPDRSTKFVSFIGILFVCSSFIINIKNLYVRYNKRQAVLSSVRYSVVNNFIVNGDTMHLTETDTLRWRSWFERVSDNKRFVTVNYMKAGAEKIFSTSMDSSTNEMVLQPFSGSDTTALHFKYSQLNAMRWCLEGTVKNKEIRIELQRINPDTIMNLLKSKRRFIISDDFSATE